jgi:exo-beta-1,3-glucanase (GH17 family)
VRCCRRCCRRCRRLPPLSPLAPLLLLSLLAPLPLLSLLAALPLQSLLAPLPLLSLLAPPPPLPPLEQLPPLQVPPTQSPLSTSPPLLQPLPNFGRFRLLLLALPVTMSDPSKGNPYHYDPFDDSDSVELAISSKPKRCKSICCCSFVVALVLAAGIAAATVFVVRSKKEDSKSTASEAPRRPTSQPSPKPAPVETQNFTGTPFNTVPIYTNTTPNSWPSARGSKVDGYHIYGISYSPFGYADNILCPDATKNNTGGHCLLPNQVEIDLAGISKLTSRVKTYSTICVNATRQVVVSAKKLGLTVMLGVWINKDKTANAAEIFRVKALINEFAGSGVFTSILVSNEAMFVLKVDPELLASAIKEVKAIVKASADPKIQVGFAEIYNTLLNKPTGDDVIQSNTKPVDKVVDAADFIGLNSHPYWGGIDPTIRDAGKHVADGWQQVVAKWKKPTIVTETGSFEFRLLRDVTLFNHHILCTLLTRNVLSYSDASKAIPLLATPIQHLREPPSLALLALRNSTSKWRNSLENSIFQFVRRG